jgi:hypothetical protein
VKADKKDLIELAIESSEIQNIYFNGVGIGLGTGDVVLTLLRNGAPQAVLNTSHIIAKTLVQGLSNAIDDFEKKTQTKILTTDEVQAAIGNGGNE